MHGGLMSRAAGFIPLNQGTAKIAWAVPGDFLSIMDLDQLVSLFSSALLPLQFSWSNKTITPIKWKTRR
jgi:hypothetical protein